MKATEELVELSFVVLPYCQADPTLCKRLVVAVDTAATKFFNQVREMPLESVAHLANGQALKIGTMDLDKLNVKRIKL